MKTGVHGREQSKGIKLTAASKITGDYYAARAAYADRLRLYRHAVADIPARSRTPLLHAFILEARALGIPVADIARDIKLSKFSVYRYLKTGEA